MEAVAGFIRKKLEGLSSFLKFCMENDWMREESCEGNQGTIANSADHFRNDQKNSTKSCGRADLFSKRLNNSQRNRTRIKTFVLLLRYSGLRIHDALMLTEDRLNDENRLFIRSAKQLRR